jgi:tetratricopeptide (TPR) repeat protein
MVARFTKLTLAGLAACALSVGPLAAQAQQQQKQQQTPPAAQQPTLPPGQTSALPGQQPPAAKPVAPKANPKEEADYKAFSDLKGIDTGPIVSKGEAFLKSYPESRYRASVYAKLAIAYQAEGNEPNMFTDAEKSVELDPDEVSALSLLAGTLPRRLNPGAPGAQAEMQKVQLYAHHAIELLSTMSKPANLTEEQFTRSKNAYLAMCHSGLGLLNYDQHNVPQAIAELEQATQLAQDPVDYFLLGMAYEAGGRYSDAVGAYTQCTAGTEGQMQDRCKEGVQEAKKKAAASPAPAK